MPLVPVKWNECSSSSIAVHGQKLARPGYLRAVSKSSLHREDRDLEKQGDGPTTSQAGS